VTPFNHSIGLLWFNILKLMYSYKAAR